MTAPNDGGKQHNPEGKNILMSSSQQHFPDAIYSRKFPSKLTENKEIKMESDQQQQRPIIVNNPETLQREQFVVFHWQKTVYMPELSAGPYLTYPMYNESHVTEKCRIGVFVQGDLDNLEGKTIFLTVHDIGKNHQSFVDFVNTKPMAELKEKAVFLHICVPGQESDAKAMHGEFPSMDILGDALAQVMAKFNLGKCVAIGEGAGADIVCRFAMKYHNLVTGIVLIHCTSTTHGILEQIKEIFMNLRLEDGSMGTSAWNYLLTQRFGNHNMDTKQRQFVDHVANEERLNEKNLSRYIYSFAHRDDFTHELDSQLAKVDAILVTGGKSAHNDSVQHMFDRMNKSKTAMLVAEDCVDVLEEAPEYVACALVMLCQRKGLFSDVQLPVIKTADYQASLRCSGAAIAGHQQSEKKPKDPSRVI